MSDDYPDITGDEEELSRKYKTMEKEKKLGYKYIRDMGGHTISDRYGKKIILFDYKNARLYKKGYCWVVSRLSGFDNLYLDKPLEEVDTIWEAEAYVSAFKRAESIGGTLKRMMIYESKDG